jgi:chromosome segregation ATPase
MEKNYMTQIDELRDAVIFTEEDAEEEKTILKNQLHGYIKENLEIKMQHDNLKDELDLKTKEVEKYQTLIESYQKTMNDSLTDYSSKSIQDQSTGPTDYVYVNKIEKLEYDKVIINNDLLQAKREISNLTLEKSCLEYKIKEIEGSFDERLDKLKTENIELEKKCNEMENKYTITARAKESNEKDLKYLKEVTKHNEDLKKVILESNTELQGLKDSYKRLNENYEEEVKANGKLEQEINQLRTQGDEKVSMRNKAVKELKEKLVEADRLNEQLREEIETEKQIYAEGVAKFKSINENLYNFEALNKVFLDKIDHVRGYMIKTNSEYLTNDLRDFNANNFDSNICIFIKTLSNEINRLKFDQEIKRQLDHQHATIMVSLQNENEFLKSLIYKKTQEHESLKTTIENLKKKEHELSQIADKAKINESQAFEEKIKELEERYTNTIECLEDEKEGLTCLAENLKNELLKKQEILGKINSESLEKDMLVETLQYEVDFISKVIYGIVGDIEERLSNHGEAIDLENEERIEVVLSYRVKQLTNVLENISNLYSLREKEVRVLTDEKKILETTIKLLENRQYSLQEKANTIESKEKEMKANNELLKKEISNNDLLKKEIAKLAKAKDGLDLGYKEELNGLNSKLTNAQKEISALKNKVAELTNEISDKDSQLDNIGGELSTRNQENEDLRKDIEIMTQQYRALENSEEMAEYETKAAKLLEILETTKNTYEERLEKLKIKHKSKLIELKEIQDQNAIEREDLEQRLLVLQGNEEQMTATINELSQKNAEIEEDLKSSIANFSTERTELEKRIAILTDKESQLTQQIDELNSLLVKQDKSAVVKQMSDKNHSLELELKESNNNLAIARNEKERLKTELESLRLQVDSNREIISRLLLGAKDIVRFNDNDLKTISIKDALNIINDVIERLRGDITRASQDGNGLFEKEKEILLSKLNERDVELLENKTKVSDLELLITTLQESYNEINKNYEYLMKNSKTAEKLNELQKKCKLLNEEKEMLSESKKLIVDSLTNEISDLKARIDELSANKEITRVEPAVQEGKYDLTVEQVSSGPVVPEVSPSKEVNMKATQSSSQQSKKNLGFFGSILAPIFLTDKDIENIQK